MKIWTNTFDDLYAEVDAIKGEAKRLGEANPDLAERIASNAYKMIENRLGQNGVSIDEWKRMKQTYEQYDIDFTDNPLTYAKGVIRSLGQGVFLGAGDELEAFFKHYVGRRLIGSENPDATYNDILLDIQAGMKAFQTRNPGVDLSAEIIGGLMVPGYGLTLKGARGLTAKGAKWISNPANREAIAQGLTAGIASTLYGVGKDHELSATNALVGAGGGYTLNRALLGQGDIVRSARDRVQNAYRETGEQAGTADKLLSKLPAYPKAPDDAVNFGGTGDPPGGIPIVGSGGKGTFDRMAMREIIQSADDENVTFEELISRLDDYVHANMGDHVTMMELVKERGPMARMMRGVTQESPQASSSYEDFLKRQIEAKKRIMPQIFSLFDPSGKMQKDGINNNIVRFLNKSKETRAKNAEGLYKQFDNMVLFDPKIDPNTIKNRKIADVNAVGEDLIGKIKTLMDADDAIKRAWTKATGKLAFNDPSMALHADDFILTGKRFNAFKKQLDGEIGKALREGNLESVKDLTQYKNIMIRQVDSMVESLTNAKRGEGVYQKARNIYSGGIAEDNAYELGKGAIREHQGKNFTQDEFEVGFDALTDSEKSFVRLGMGSGYRDALLGDMTELTPNVRKLILGGAEENVLLNKFDYAFKDMTEAPKGGGLSGKERAKEFKEVLNKEGRFIKSFRYLFGGPGSAERLAESGAISSKMDDVVDSVMELGPEALVTGGVPKYGIARTITRNITPNRLKTRQMVKEKFGGAIWNRAGAMGEDPLRVNLTDLMNYKRQLDLRLKGGLLTRYARPEIGAYNLLQTGPYTPPMINPDAYE